MPVNSFENYPMTWTPRKEELRSPIYVSLADMMADDIKRGTLLPNTQLPPQRELADYLDLNLSTITKAYKLCTERGLIHAIVGRGTFVTPNANVPTSVIEKGNMLDIEMATIHPFYEQNKLVRDVTIEMLQRPFSETLFEYSHPLGSWSQIQTAAQWLRRYGLDADENTTMIAGGVQNALAIVLTALFETGNTIAVDPYTYANFISLAQQLHLNLVPVENDTEGMRADVLEAICQRQPIHGIYLMPTGSNPTNIALSAERRLALAEVIKRHKLFCIEDDNFAALLPQHLPPISQLLPEQSIYISGLSKPLCAGLRIAYMRIPAHAAPKLEQGAFSQTLKISSLNMEIATTLIQQGLDEKIIAEKRALSLARNQIFHEYFPDVPYSPESYSQWLPLPAHLSGHQCEIALAQQGVGVYGAERFAVDTHLPHNAIRIATASPATEAALATGLEIVRNYIEQQTHTTRSYII